MSKQLHRHSLPGMQTEAARLERALQLAFLNSTAALPKRPEGTNGSRFNNTAREDNPTRPWRLFAEALRAVATDAARIGGPCIEQTEERIADAVICFMEYTLEPLRKPIGSAGYRVVSKEMPEAVEAITTEQFVPTPENKAVADREACQAALSLQLYRASLRRSRDFPLPMGATPR